MQAIANTAGFHFATFDQAGSSVYTNLILNVSRREVLRVLVSILGVEVDHFAVWHDKAGNAISQPLAGVTDPETGVMFPDLNSPPFGGEEFQTNLIFPEPCAFIDPNLPACSIIRPSLKQNAGAVATATAIVNSQLFLGQSQAFFDAVTAWQTRPMPPGVNLPATIEMASELTYAASNSALHCVLPDASAIRETTLIVTRSQRSPRNWNAFESVAPARS